MGVSSLLYNVPDQSYGLTYLYRALPRVFGLYSIYSIGEDMCTYIYRKFIRTARLKTQRLPLYPFRNKRMCVLKVLNAMNFSIMSDESLLDQIPIVVCRPNNVILPVNIWPFTFLYEVQIWSSLCLSMSQQLMVKAISRPSAISMNYLEIIFGGKTTLFKICDEVTADIALFRVSGVTTDWDESLENKHGQIPLRLKTY